MNKLKTLICVAIIFVAAAVIALGVPVSRNPLWSFSLYTILFIALYVFVFKADDKGDQLYKSAIFIAISGIILRVLFISYPLSDDVNRYAWEGMIQSRGINPYITTPAELSAQFANDPVFAGINHKDVSTAYPPIAILTFRVISSISYSLSAYKLFFIICDSLVVALIALLIKQWKVSECRLALYAWNPLVLLYGAGEGHVDILHVFMIVISLILFFAALKPATTKTIGFVSGLAFFVLGAAVMTKFLSVIILPFVITRRNAKWLPCFLIPFLTIIPFWSPDMFSGLMKFSGEISYNDVMPKMLRYFLSGTSYQLGMLVAFTGGFLVIWLMAQQRKLPGIFYSFLWCLLCLPCVHTWYLIPLALLIIAVPHRSVFLLFMTIGSEFWVMNYQLITGEWKEFLWIWIVSYIPVFILLFYDWNNLKLPWLKPYPFPKTADIIVPVYNESIRINEHLSSVEKAIQAASETGMQFKIIAVDGGSTDNTVELIKKFDVRLIKSPTPGRGNQIAAGFASSAGDIVIMLHADSLMHRDALRKLADKIRRNPSIGWGIFGHNYDKISLRMDKVRFMNRFRFKVMGIAFGDQGIFIRRDIMESQGGIPAIPLMEDVEISLRLAAFPRVSLGESLTLSARRWKNRTLFTYSFQVIYFVLWYLIGRKLGFNIQSISKRLYWKYYKK
jgi:hypothetical protein